jgi:membrane-associated HD superfamily phosphohydrolase
MAKHLPSLTPSPANPFGRPSKRRAKRDARRAGSAPAPSLWQTLRTRLPALDGARIALAVGTVLILSSLLSLHLLPDKVSLQQGEVSNQEIRAARTVQYVDQTTTREMRAQAAARVYPVYRPSPYAASDVAHSVTETYALLRRERSQGIQNTQRVALDLRQQVGISLLNPSLLSPLLRPAASPYHLDQAEHATQQALRETMDVQVIHSDRPDNLAEGRDAVAIRLASTMLPREDIPAVAALARALLQPNFQPDAHATDKARDAQRQSVTPVVGQIFAGDIVVRRGEVVTDATVDKLQALGLQNPRLDPGTVVSVTGLTALMVGLVVIYLARYQRSVYVSTKMLLLLSVLVILSVLGLKLGGSMLGVRLSEAQFGYVGVLCMAADAMLIASLIHPRVAMVVTALLAAQSGLILGNDLRFSVMTLLSSMIGIYAVSDIRSRKDVVRAGVALCAANVLLSLLLGRIEGDMTADIGQSVLWAFLAGMLSVALFSVAADLFERLFGITTHLGLLELSDPNRPLLQKFCQIAPGTYTHSVMVGNLAVVAAEAIGADALLCRVLRRESGEWRERP